MNEEVLEKEIEEISEESKNEEVGLATEILRELHVQNKRMAGIIYFLLAMILLIVGGFIWYLNQYEFESYVQDGSGYNNINTGEQGDVINGAEIPYSEEKER